MVVKTKKNGSMTWKVIDSIDPDPVEQSLRYTTILSTGLSVSIVKITKKASSIFLRLLFKDWRKKVEKLNEAVVASKCKCRLFTPKEFLVGLGIIIGAAEFVKRGSDLFAVKDQGGEEDQDVCVGGHRCR